LLSLDDAVLDKASKIRLSRAGVELDCQ